VSEASAARPRAVSRWHAFETWVGTRTFLPAVLGVSLAVYGIQSAVLPAYAGRDMARYLQAFVQLGYRVPIYPAVLNTRGPFAALGVGLPLELGGWAAEIWLALLYALSIVAWTSIARTFGARAAVLTSVALLISPGYAILFHELASDSLFAVTFAGWAVLVMRALLRPATTAFLFVGLGMGALVLVRPDNEVLILMALVPLFLRGPWRQRLSWVAAFVVGSVVVSQAWTAFADLRWGSAVSLRPSSLLLGLAVVLTPFLLPTPWRARVAVGLAVLAVAALAVKGLPGQSPTQYIRVKSEAVTNQLLYRSFELDRIMSPNNGSASRKAAQIVERDLLTREPYRSYGVTAERFFASGSDRVFGDLTGVVPGPTLAAATREAIGRHPWTFARSIAKTFWEDIAIRPVYAPQPPARPVATPSAGSQPATTTQSPSGYVVVQGHRLPRPTEGQPIPASAIGPALWTPGGQAVEVWRSPTSHHTVFTDARDQRRADRFYNATGRLANRIPTRNGNAQLDHRLNQLSHVFPPIVAWLVIGLVALFWRRPERTLVAVAPALAALIVIMATAVVAPSVAEYSAPVSPAFILLASVGLVGAPVAGWRRESWRARVASVRPVVGTLIGSAAAVWCVKIYYDGIKGYVDGAGPQHDLAVFLTGAGRVLDGASPYAFHGDQTFAYPPLLAFLVAPLHPLSGWVAGLTWMLISLAVVVVALWWLELRDWRCYALAGVYLFTRSSIDLGTIEPLLLLGVAAAWRWRKAVVEPAVAVGAAIVLKLFLWPLVVWFALMRRLRTAAIAVGVAIGLAVLSWAVIGFAGLGTYPSVLRKLADHESTSSYSVVALGVRAHLPLTAARAVSVLVALGLLAAAAWIARDRARTDRNRDVAILTLTLTAALAASPIVWVHYFLLLLVPLALTSPRLSWLWFVPFAFSPLGEASWPAGNARDLALALVATLVILGAAVVRRREAPASKRGSDPVRGLTLGDHAPLRLSSWSRIRSGT
jgi:Glycosyltransferase family 87/Dolichyl-phosphate-mannose-protein mannosyltransferase